MQKVMQVHQDLHGARTEYASQDRRGGQRTVHHKGKRNGGQNEGKNETGEVRLETSLAGAGAVNICLTHLHNSHQVDDTEYTDPNDIQKMPEHTQTHEP